MQDGKHIYIESIPKKDMGQFTAEMDGVALEYSSPVKITQNLSLVGNNLPRLPSNSDIAEWGIDVTRMLLEKNGFDVKKYPNAGRSNALLAEKKGLVMGNLVKFTVFPKTSRSANPRQIRLGTAEFVIQRQESKDEEFYFGFVPKEGAEDVFSEFDPILVRTLT